ncbi:dihydroorotase [Haladaptatus paucihalophilus DX253]|uniref:Dihydroorotase n=1 Tax=Haladaptatus paucihalophilus DX253 TaxID=797209 RepID=E7QUD5_HALPU|nr:dihydroorotase [Haladaptatus paucihalophilus]EFW92214.1 dihydroorotase [Haladaptatus paucihalophilus DX253]SHK91984.1 dihydroorotase [Haladaptatus paucihalophilus DX253]
MLTIRNATLPDGSKRDVRIETDAGRISAIGSSLTESGEVVDATGKLLLPGAIDAHVHFRQPGFSHKETWETGSKSAAAGGVTTVVDQPNTNPPTVDGPSFDEKAELAARSYVDYGINGGVTPDWNPDELLDEPILALGEVFLADSTGKMGIEADLFRSAVERATDKYLVVTVHAENADLFDSDAKSRDDADAWSAYRTAEAESDAVERACEIGTELGARLHIAHTSTPEGIDAATEAGATCEVTPHHMFLSRDDLDELGTFGRMNPPLRSEERREEVFARVADGTVDMIATDHAPHTREEKDAGIWDAPSGVPGVETMLPLLLEEARKDNLSYERVADLTARTPSKVFGLPRKGRIEEGRMADLVLVDPDATREIRAEDLHTKCDWTPFEGWTGVFPEVTMVRGNVVFEDGEFGEQIGENVRA